MACDHMAPLKRISREKPHEQTVFSLRSLVVNVNHKPTQRYRSWYEARDVCPGAVRKNAAKCGKLGAVSRARLDYPRDKVGTSDTGDELYNCELSPFWEIQRYRTGLVSSCPNCIHQRGDFDPRPGR